MIKRIRLRTYIALGLIVILAPLAFAAVYGVLGALGGSNATPVAVWHFDEGTDNTCSGGTNDACDTSGNGYNAAFGASTAAPTWQAPDNCVSGSCLYFDGSNDTATESTSISSIQTVSFWVKVLSTSTTEQIIDLNGTDYFTSVSGTVTVNGFGTDTIYVDGVSGATTLTAGNWHHVAVTTTTGFSASALTFGNVSTNYGNMYLDEVKFFTSALTADQVKAEYTGGAAVFGASSSANTYLNQGLLGYWKLDESSGNASDSSGNGLTLTNNGTTTYVNGEFGNGSEHVPASLQYLSTATTISGVKTVSFWTNPDVNTNYYISLTSSTYITSSSGTLSATGFTDPTIYVNGVVSSTITANTWQFVTVTDTTAINANTFYIGRQGSNYYDGTMDDVRLYDRALSASDEKLLYKWGPGPVGYWKFDENTGTSTAFDSSSNGGNLTLSNITASDWVPGKFGSALSFTSASSQYASVADTSALSITGDVSVGAWIYPQSTTAATTFPIAGKANSSTTSYSLVQYGDEIRMYIGSTSNYETTNAANLSTNTWYYVQGVYDATAQTVKLYVNGTLEASTTTGTIPASISDGTDGFGVAIENTGTTVNYQVGSSGGDGDTDEAADTTNSLTRTTLPLGSYNGNPHMVVATFTTVAVPQAATISSATATLNPSISYTCSGCTLSSTVSMEDADTATTLTTTNMNNLTKTTANSTWNIASETANVEHSVTITSAVQEVVNRASWASGNNMNVIFNDNGSTGSEWQDYYSYNNTPSKAPKLSITYTSANYYNGTIDDVKVYNYARSAQQVIEDMNGGHPTGGSPVGSATSYWKFDEGYGTTAYDANTTSANNLTLSSASWTTSGKYNSAWNGTGSVWLSRADDADFDFGASQDFSISMWVKSSSASNPGANQFLIDKQDTASVNAPGYRMYFNTSGQIVCDIDDDSTSYPEDSATTSTDYYDNTWHNVVCVRDITGGDLNLYVDGVLANADTSLSATGDLSNAQSLYIGDDDGDATNSFAGDIDEVRIFRSALTASQVKITYNANSASNFGVGIDEKSTTYGGPGGNAPIAHLNFDENTGTTANDTAGGGYTGTLAGSTLPLWQPGKISSALYFTGTDAALSRVTFTDDTFDSLANGTITFWFKPDGTGDSFQDIFFGGVSGGASNAFEFAYIPGTPDKLEIYTVGCTPNVRGTASIPGTATDWHFAAFTSTTGANALYIDGAPVTVSYTAGSATDDCFLSDISGAANTKYQIGRTQNLSSENYKGLVDDFKIYDYALSATQVAYEYNRGKPVAWWKLDENHASGDAYTLYDNSINNNGDASGYNGTAHYGANTTGMDCTVSGKRNLGCSLDGTDDYISVADTSALRFDSASQDFSIAAWVKRATTGTEDIISKEDADNDGWRMMFNASNQLVCSQDLSDATSTSTITDTNWHHVACTIDRDGNMQSYIDGKADGSATALSSDAMATTTAIAIGAQSYATITNYFNGTIDDVRLFSYALSAKQILNVMNDGAAYRWGPETGSP